VAAAVAASAAGGAQQQALARDKYDVLIGAALSVWKGLMTVCGFVRLTVSVEEKIVLDLERDGGIKKLEVTIPFKYS